MKTFHTVDELAASLLPLISSDEDSRLIVALVGAPGSGKSTLANQLIEVLDAEQPDLCPVIVPMDGFHLDNEVLDRRGLLARKGAPETFDALGYLSLLDRIHGSRETVWAPRFDRSMELSRAGIIEISRRNRLVITEGNYLLLRDSPWNAVTDLVDLSLWIDVGMETLRQRLMQRWFDHGYSEQEAMNKVEGNDLPNARYIIDNSKPADARLLNVQATCRGGRA